MTDRTPQGPANDPQEAAAAAPAGAPAAAASVAPGQPKAASVQRSSAILAAGTLVSRVLGFVKAGLLAVVIGNTGSQAAAAFGLANQLPNNVYILVAGGVMSAVLVPAIVKASLGDDGGQAFVRKLLTLGGTIFLLLALIATVAAPVLVNLYASSGDDGRGFTAEQMGLAVALAYWCLPQIFFYALYTLLGEIFNARGQFGPYTWAPVVNNVVSIAGLVLVLLLVGNRTIDPAAWTPDRVALLGGVTTAGVAVQALVLVLLFRRTGMTFKLDFGWRGVGLRATGQRAGWLFGVVIIGQIKGLVQSRVVTLADPDGANLFTMQNAWFVFSLPHSVIAVSIAIAYFTRMSHHASRGDLAGIRSDVSGALRGVGMLTTISAIVLAVVAVPFWRYFDESFGEMLQSSFVLWAMLIGLVAFSAEYVLQRVYFALEDTRTPFLYALFGMLVTFALLWACTLLPGMWIVAGASLAVTIANLVSCSVWIWLVRRKIGAFGFRLVAKRHVQYLAYAVVAAIPGVLIVWGLGGFRDGGWASAATAPALIASTLAGGAMAVVYFGLLFLTKNPDFRSTLDMVLARFTGRGRSVGGAAKD
ncbi:murein biosynthesis integral membrane protein MurJ [Agrococcus jejuensis]|uniref:murein biosynthesis integral membrane protein MurJ n=1 Tax=Agrococcus jejuensis TaxID=399736 RepID=UPI0011A02B94|nr:lipid II flippase MurJ [Agrococcus jejuensis]